MQGAEQEVTLGGGEADQHRRPSFRQRQVKARQGHVTGRDSVRRNLVLAVTGCAGWLL
ncbi:hypothetical protein GCM10010496_72770 [Streptomyces asoensis]|nr:hypothetical protein GCM10010496_72770 [Streptomyces asoensis]